MLLPILSLARSGATSRAWEAFIAAGLDGVEDINALTLKGRLLKDRARQAAGTERAALFAQSGAAYRQASHLRPDSYPLINAAAMALFAGDGASAASIARDVLTLIDADPSQGETPYWREATRAEAMLLLGRLSEAEDALGEAIIRAPMAWEDHAATLRQFAAIIAAQNGEAAWLNPYRPPPSVHYSGILGLMHDDAVAAAAIREAIADIAPGFAYGALAAGADIVAAEALVERGAELHITLPSSPEDFCASSVRPFGADWERRFDALIDQAASLTLCTESLPTSGASVALAEYVAMGKAAENATLLESHAVALRIEPEARPALGDPWLASGRALIHVAVTADNTILPGAALPEGELLFFMASADAATSFTSLHEAVAGMQSTQAAIALDCRIDGKQSVADDLWRNATPGTIIASSAAAMALMAEGRCSRIEPLGEMETSDGTMGVYAIALAASD